MQARLCALLTSLTPLSDVFSVSISRKGDRVLLGQTGHVQHCAIANEGRSLCSLSGVHMRDWVRFVSFTLPDDRLAVTYDDTRTLCVFDLTCEDASRRQLYELPLRDAVSSACISVSRVRPMLAYVSESGALHCIDLLTAGGVVSTWSASATANDVLAAIGALPRNADGLVEPPPPIDKVASVQASASTAHTAIAWSADGLMLAAASAGVLTVFDAFSWGAVRSVQHPSGAQWDSLSWRSDGNALVALDTLGSLHVFSGELRALRVVNEGGFAHCVRWSPDGRRIAAARDRSVAMIDSASMQTVSRVPTGSVTVWANGMTWAPDGSRLIVSPLRGHEVFQALYQGTWTPELHKHFPAQFRGIARVLLTLSNFSRATDEPFFPESPLSEVPVELVFIIFEQMSDMADWWAAEVAADEALELDQRARAVQARLLAQQRAPAAQPAYVPRRDRRLCGVM